MEEFSGNSIGGMGSANGNGGANIGEWSGNGNTILIMLFILYII